MIKLTLEEKKLIDDILYEMHKETVYFQYTGDWLEIQCDNLTVSISIYSGAVVFYDPNKQEEICRIE